VTASEATPTAAFLRFVHEHRGDDVTRLLLGKAPDGVDLRAAAAQIAARQKARTKLPDWYSAEGLLFPPPLSVEQASSQATAAYKARLVAGECLVDLAGGMGVDTLALASRFRRTVYVEQDPELCRCFAHNAARFGANVEVVNATAEAYVDGFRGRAVFYIDPARRDDARNRVFLFEDCRPNVPELLPQLRQIAERVLVKASPMLDVTEGIRQLAPVREVHVVAVANECKELLFLLDFDFAGEPTICCIDLGADPPDDGFRFTLAAEHAAPVVLADPGHYLYDPNAAIRKAGAFRLIGQTFGLAKLAPNTHLYTSDSRIADFPGRVFEIEGDAGRNPRRALADGRANVIARNHPLGVDGLRRRFNLREGGERFLIGFRDRSGQARLVFARRCE
jgi:hypothetical protein